MKQNRNYYIPVGNNIAGADVERFAGSNSDWYEDLTVPNIKRISYVGRVFKFIGEDNTVCPNDIRTIASDLEISTEYNTSNLPLPPTAKPLETGVSVQAGDVVYYTENSPLPLGAMPADTSPANYFGNIYVQTVPGSEAFFNVNADFVVSDDVSNHWKAGGSVFGGPIEPSTTHLSQRLPLHTIVEARTGLSTTEDTVVFFGANSEIRDDYTWDAWFDTKDYLNKVFLFQGGVTIGDDYAADITSGTAFPATGFGLNSQDTTPPYLRDLVPGITTETTALRNHYKITSNSVIPDQGQGYSLGNWWNVASTSGVLNTNYLDEIYTATSSITLSDTSVLERSDSTAQVTNSFSNSISGKIFPPSAKAARGNKPLNTNTWYWIDTSSPFGGTDPTAWGITGATLDKTMKLSKPIYDGVFDLLDVRTNKFDFASEANLDLDTLWPGVFKNVSSLANLSWYLNNRANYKHILYVSNNNTNVDFTITKETTFRVTLVGGGGGTGTSDTNGCGGGGGGGYNHADVVLPAGTYRLRRGSGGTASGRGIAGGNGNASSLTSVTLNKTVMTANGGSGGGNSAGNYPRSTYGGGGGSTYTNTTDFTITNNIAGNGRTGGGGRTFTTGGNGANGVVRDILNSVNATTTTNTWVGSSGGGGGHDPGPGGSGGAGAGDGGRTGTQASTHAGANGGWPGNGAGGGSWMSNVGGTGATGGAGYAVMYEL